MLQLKMLGMFFWDTMYVGYMHCLERPSLKDLYCVGWDVKSYTLTRSLIKQEWWFEEFIYYYISLLTTVYLVGC